MIEETSMYGPNKRELGEDMSTAFKYFESCIVNSKRPVYSAWTEVE
jgi:hypothetical protein